MQGNSGSQTHKGRTLMYYCYRGPTPKSERTTTRNWIVTRRCREDVTIRVAQGRKAYQCDDRESHRRR